MIADELKGRLLDEFLNQWHIDDVKEMKLQKYVSVGDKDTFCQWVETKTRELGSINGMPSIKFGIYERKDPEKKPKKYKNDNKYSWLQGYGSDKNEAFDNIKKDIIKIIEFSEKGKFEEIDEFILPNIFKWKVAYLYSNDRLIPIFKKEILLKIAKHFDLKNNQKAKVSEIQKLMISNKPANQDIHNYTHNLYDKFGGNTKNENSKEVVKGQKRQGVKTRNIKTQVRTISSSSYIAEQKHNKIQETLRKQLINKYGEENVIFEENFVDVKLIQPNYLGFYEVKSSSYASQCIKEALGQILLYSYNDQDIRDKKIYVVGQYPATEQECGYINFIKEKLKLDFEYLNVDLE